MRNYTPVPLRSGQRGSLIWLRCGNYRLLSQRSAVLSLLSATFVLPQLWDAASHTPRHTPDDSPLSLSLVMVTSSLVPAGSPILASLPGRFRAFPSCYWFLRRQTEDVLSKDSPTNRLPVHCYNLSGLWYQLCQPSECKFNTVYVKFSYTQLTQLMKRSTRLVH